MSSTDYGFDGLDEYAELFERAAREWPQEFQRLVLDIAHELQGRLSSDLTPKDTGHLRGSWTVGDIVRKGGEYVVEVYTDLEYADPVNYGHRTRGGGYVPGAHMMEISLAQVEERLPPTCARGCRTLWRRMIYKEQYEQRIHAYQGCPRPGNQEGAA